MEAAKSPPSMVRAATPKGVGTPTAAALKVILKILQRTSTPTDARRMRCAHQGNPSGAPPSGHPAAIT